MKKIVILFPIFAVCFTAEGHAQAALTDAQVTERLISAKWAMESAQVVPKGEMTQKKEAFARQFTQEQAQTFRTLEFTPDGKMIVNGLVWMIMNFNVEKGKLVVMANNLYQKEGESNTMAFDFHFSDPKTFSLHRSDANNTYTYTFKAQ